MARNIYAKKIVSEDGKTVTFDMQDDKVENVVIAIKDFPLEIQRRLAQHGAGQKFGDSFAGAKVNNVAEAAEELKTLCAQLMAGDWNAAREGGGGAKGGKVVLALHRMAERNSTAMQTFMGIDDVSKDAIRTWFVGRSDALKKAIRSAPEIVEEIAAMDKEHASTAPSLMSLDGTASAPTS